MSSSVVTVLLAALGAALAATVAVSALVRLSSLPSSSVKPSLTLSFLPWSAAARA